MRGRTGRIGRAWPISAKLVADLLETAGASRVLSLDLHAPQIQGYFNIPVDHLYAAPVLVEYFQKKQAGADDGGFARCGRRGAGAAASPRRIDAPLAIVDKRRIDVNVSEVMHLIGDVAGRPALVIDDIIDTAGTLVKTAEALLENGATKVFAACTHPVLSGPAVERIHEIGDRGSGGDRFGAAERGGARSCRRSKC